MEKTSFFDFDKSSLDAWQQKAIVELKGKSYDETLHWVKKNDLEVASFLNEESTKNLPILQIQQAQKKSTEWLTVTTINYKPIYNFEEIFNDFKSNGFEIVNIFFDKSILVTDIKEVVTTAKKATIKLFLTFEQFKDENSISNLDIDVILGISYLNNALQVTYEKQPTLFLSQLVTEDEIEGLGALLNQLVIRLQSVDYKINKGDLLGFKIPVSSNYFLTIAKLRAFRYVVKKLLKSFDINPEIFIWTRANLLYDESDNNLNIVRSAICSLSSVIGGSDYIEIPTFDGKEEAFGFRIAKNTSLILRNEAFLDKVADPLAGSYFIEKLTYELIKKLWSSILEKT